LFRSNGTDSLDCIQGFYPGKEMSRKVRDKIPVKLVWSAARTEMKSD
jgi:hypothetical protein